MDGVELPEKVPVTELLREAPEEPLEEMHTERLPVAEGRGLAVPLGEAVSQLLGDRLPLLLAVPEAD